MSLKGRTLILVLLGSSLAACYELYVKPYGYAAYDDLDSPKDGRYIEIPPNAPSILNGFGPKSGSNDEQDGHQAIDVAGDVGLPILAAASGRVLESYFEPMYGNHVVIDHGKDVDGRFFQTRYLHLDARRVQAGDRVVRGQQIGDLGRTGTLAIYIPHMHFEVFTARIRGRYAYEAVNPHLFWVDGPGRVTCFDRNQRYTGQPFKTTYPAPCRGVPWQR